MYAKNCFINTGDSAMFEMLLSNGLSVYTADYYGLSFIDYCKKDGVKQIGCIKIYD